MKATWPARSGKAPCRRPAGLCAAAACVLALGLPVGLLAGSGSARASGAEQDATAFQMTPGHTGASSDPMGPQWTEAWSATGSGPFSYALIAGGQVSSLVESSSPTLEAYKPPVSAVDWSVAVGAEATGIRTVGAGLRAIHRPDELL